MKTELKSTKKSDVIKNKLMEAGVSLEEADKLSHEVLGIAYRRTKSIKLRWLEQFEKEFGETKRWAVFNFICQSLKYPTRQDIANGLGYRRSTVCGRVKELLDLGVIVVGGTTEDPQTGKTVQTLMNAASLKVTA